MNEEYKIYEIAMPGLNWREEIFERNDRRAMMRARGRIKFANFRWMLTSQDRITVRRWNHARHRWQAQPFAVLAPLE